MLKTVQAAGEQNSVERNIAAVHRVRKDADDYRRRDQIVVDRIAGFLGSTYSVYAHLLFYGLLIAVSLLGGRDFFWRDHVNVNGISLTASLEAIFLAIFVLTNQKRMGIVERKSADLGLQMSLLTENELTRLARVTELIAQRLGVNTSQIEHFDQVKEDVRPEDILARIESHESEHPTDSISSGATLGKKAPSENPPND